MAKNLHRSNSQKVLGGVAGGIAEYFDIDPVIVRILFIIAMFGAGVSVLVYFIMWIIIPVSPYTWENYDHNSSQSSNSDYSNSSENQSSFNEHGEQENPENYNEHLNKTPEESSQSLKIFFGISLVVIGGLIFLDRIIDNVNFEYIFPGILIAVGAFLIYKTGTNK